MVEKKMTDNSTDQNHTIRNYSSGKNDASMKKRHENKGI